MKRWTKARRAKYKATVARKAELRRDKQLAQAQREDGAARTKFKAEKQGAKRKQKAFRLLPLVRVSRAELEGQTLYIDPADPHWATRCGASSRRWAGCIRLTPRPSARCMRSICASRREWHHERPDQHI